jgi:APA family basic amino acid/polyamine antiporter
LFNPSHFANFAPFGLGALQPFGGMADYSSSAQPYGIIAVSAFVFFSYIGFDTATTTAEECKDPQRDVPLGVMGALVIGTLIYCATAIVLIGAVPWNKVPAQDPLVFALRPLHMPWVSAIITVGVLAGTTSVALSSLLGQARIFYVMARDKMLPPAVAKIHPRFKTPVRTTMLTGCAVAILTLIVPLTDLLNLVNIGTLAAFTVVCGGVIYLRRKRPDLPRSFKVPFVPLFPIMGIVLSAFLAIFGLSAKTWTWFVLALLVGLVFFFSYGFHKSKPEEIEPVAEPEGLSD